MRDYFVEKGGERKENGYNLQNYRKMSATLRQKLKDLEKKAKIVNKEYMEQALLAVIEYEQRMNLTEQNISLIEECVDIINNLNGINKEHEISRAKKAGKRIVDRIRSSDLDSMNESELREVFRFETEKDDREDIPDDEYLAVLLTELHGKQNEASKYFTELRQQYEEVSIDISNLSEEDILGLLHNESVRVAENESANMQLIVELLKKRELRKGFAIPEEDKKMLKKAFIGSPIPYKKKSVEGKVIRKLLGVQQSSRSTKAQKRKLNDFFYQSIVEMGEGYSRIAKFRLKRRRLYKTVQIAIITSLILAIVQISSLALFEHDFFGSAFDWTKEMFISLLNDKTEEDYNFSASSLSKVYTTVEDFAVAENMELIIPEYMPNNTTLVKIVYINDTIQGNGTIQIKYTNNVDLLINMNENLIPEDYKEVADVYINGDFEYILYKNSGQMDFISNGNTYRLFGDFTVEEFKQIIDSIYE